MRYGFALFVSAVSLVAFFSPAASASTPTCSGLSALSLPNTTIDLAQSYTAGQEIDRMVAGKTVATTTAPVALCRVAGTVKPGSNSNVHFEVWIPTDSWNGKYQQIGNGGFAGAISIGTIANAVSRGYATAGTDDGTSGNPPAVTAGAAAFIGNMDVLLDYGYRAIKATTDDSKAIIEAFTGHAPAHSYFVGCSDGGREALKEAQVFPQDFDGIIVGSPVNDQVGEFGSSYLFDSQATLTGPQTNGVPDAYIPPEKLAILGKAARAQCAGKDGGLASDNFLSDPSQCLFDPGVVQCQGGQDPSTCLTAAQVAAARKIYAGPHDHGHLLFPGYEPGAEDQAGDWQSWLTGNGPTPTPPTPPSLHGSQYTLGFGFGCDLMQGVTNCDYLSINVVQQDAAARKSLQPILSSVDPDLREFREHGGKLIQYAGWADTAIAPQNGLNYYRKVLQTMGPNVPDFYRVFMVPGMAHCSGGAGVNAFGNGTVNGPDIDADHDLLKALEAWVEQGTAPKRIIATHYVNNSASQGIDFQRPLCPYPQRGEYQGGIATSAASFACVPHHDSFDPRNIGPQVAYEPEGEQDAAARRP